ncbi:MAG TPA: ABC transporter ATP-binding protein [Alphaproteobacteria bacterium]|jgi:peptide/nickel transport system ATP-binding protein|nr:ABC transporter ATP-binding protein [Alphaproteobacteria bacterium]
MPPPVLRVADLSVALHRDGRAHAVLDRISLEVRRGEIVAMLGESGSGKSTLGLAVMGLLPSEAAPTVSGSVAVDGIELLGGDALRWRTVRCERLGTVFQDPIGSLNPSLRIGAQLAEAAPDGTPPARWLERVGIPDPESRLMAYPHQLSGGQCQRVMIAMAVAKRPGLIIADEPTTALDVVVQAQILDLLRRLAREDGIAMLFVTHDLAVASALADRIVVMHAGRLVEDGPVDRLATRPGHPYTAALLGARFGLAADRARQLPTLATSKATGDGDTTGCAFASRCPLVMEHCRTVRPPSMAAAHGGTVSCFRAAEVGPDLWTRALSEWPASFAAGKTEILVEMAMVQKTFAGHRRLIGRPAQPVRALSGINLRIYRGESVAVVGASGSGKSTLLRIAAGLVEPDDGDVVYAPGPRPQVIFQDARGSLTPWLSIGEQIGERLRPLGLAGAEREARVVAALAQVGLDPKLAGARARDLSGGQCQRAALARAIVVPPSLLLCDEAISAMDMTLAAAMLNLIGSLCRSLGMALLFVTHDLAAARFVADRIVVMAGGEIVEMGDADAIVTAPAHEATQALLAAMPDRLTRAVA